MGNRRFEIYPPDVGQSYDLSDSCSGSLVMDMMKCTDIMRVGPPPKF